MSHHKALETACHALHLAEKTEIGKHAIHSAGTVAVGAAVAAAPVVAGAAIAAAPFVLAGAAIWGICKLLD